LNNARRPELAQGAADAPRNVAEQPLAALVKRGARDSGEIVAKGFTARGVKIAPPCRRLNRRRRALSPQPSLAAEPALDLK
jgi:hypothetical protein